MRSFILKTIPILLVSMIMIVPSSGQTSVVQDGEPLHLWLKRSPTQDMTTLHFYKPLDNEQVRTDARFRHNLGPKGTENDELVMFFPTDQQSNFLQFEHNDTLTGNYSFMISALSLRGTKFELKIDLSFDQDRDGDYDKVFSFTIKENTSLDTTRFEGDIDIPANLIEKFDGKKGGRVRMTISREDDLDINVLIYCGFQGEFSYIWLPFSKYTYVPPNNEDQPNYTLYVVLGIAAAAVFVLVIVLASRAKQEESVDDIPSQRRSKRKR